MSFKYQDLASEVVRSCAAGHPMVLLCHPVRNEHGKLTPFPTLFWLACPAIARVVATLERDGLIARLEQRIAEDPELQVRIRADHDAYTAERWSRLTPAELEILRASGHATSLERRGIGGIDDRMKVKCLHLHAAHHLARGSTIGRLIQESVPLNECPRED